MRKTCEWCQAEVDSEKCRMVLPYENGSNSHGYWICPKCGSKNTLYGYGEDD